jgi:hypothetical protein
MVLAPDRCSHPTISTVDAVSGPPIPPIGVNASVGQEVFWLGRTAYSKPDQLAGADEGLSVVADTSKLTSGCGVLNHPNELPVALTRVA